MGGPGGGEQVERRALPGQAGDRHAAVGDHVQVQPGSVVQAHPAHAALAAIHELVGLRAGQLRHAAHPPHDLLA